MNINPLAYINKVVAYCKSYSQAVGGAENTTRILSYSITLSVIANLLLLLVMAGVIYWQLNSGLEDSAYKMQGEMQSQREQIDALEKGIPITTDKLDLAFHNLKDCSYILYTDADGNVIECFPVSKYLTRNLLTPPPHDTIYSETPDLLNNNALEIWRRIPGEKVMWLNISISKSFIYYLESKYRMYIFASLDAVPDAVIPLVNPYGIYYTNELAVMRVDARQHANSTFWTAREQPITSFIFVLLGNFVIVTCALMVAARELKAKITFAKGGEK